MFNKAAVFTDLHLGEHSDSEVFNKDCEIFVDWFLEQAEEHGADRIIFCGDWFHNQVRLRKDTVDTGTRLLKKLKKYAPVDMLVGNHDMFFKTDRKVHSLADYAEWAGVNVYNEVTVRDGIGMCPYLVGTEYLEVQEIQATHIFGHFELPRFMLNSCVVLEDKGQFGADHITGAKSLFSGHFHMRQMQTNKHGMACHYIGSPFGHNFNDANDRDRGMMILPFGGEPTFINHDGPIYQRYTVSEVIEMVEGGALGRYTRANSVLEIKDDVGLELGDITELREILTAEVRAVRVIPQSVVREETQEVVEGIQSKPIPEVVTDLLNKVDPHGSGIDPALLVKIFKAEL